MGDGVFAMISSWADLHRARIDNYPLDLRFLKSQKNSYVTHARIAHQVQVEHSCLHFSMVIFVASAWVYAKVHSSVKVSS